MEKTIKAGTLFLEEAAVQNGTVVVSGGKIKAIGEQTADVLDLSHLTVVPGFVDIHVHGGNTFDTMDLTAEALRGMSEFKLKEGVTSFCPTTVTSSLEKTVKAVETVREAMRAGVPGAKICGSFLEGPYINKKYKGAHPESFIRDVNVAEIAGIIEAGGGTVISFAMAPELPGAEEAIKFLRQKGVVVRIGHSAASYEEAQAGFKNGASIGIHTYNAMSPLTHREPGVVGAIFTNDDVYGEVIADLVHTSPAAIDVLLRCKGPDKVVLITDCMMAGGMPDGSYKLGVLDVIVKNGVCRLSSGALAGSTLTILKAVQNMVRRVGASLFDAVKMASQNPAKAIGRFHEIGGIAPGKAADLVGLDEELNIRFLMLDGRRII